MRLPDLFEGAADAGARRPTKSADAFRTISEVAGELEVPQHVLRFWESKFPQVKPMKRAGGRRYYRPDDVALLRRIRQWLYEQGYTIKGVQKLLREGALKGAMTSRVPLTPSAALASGAAQARVEKADRSRSMLLELREELVQLRTELAALRAVITRAEE